MVTKAKIEKKKDNEQDLTIVTKAKNIDKGERKTKNKQKNIALPSTSLVTKAKKKKEKRK